AMSEETFLYLTTTGWKSGRPHEIEIWFVAADGCYYAVAEGGDRAHWVQNIRPSPAVGWMVGTRDQHAAAGPQRRPGYARALAAPDDAEHIARIRRLMEARYGWSRGLVVQICPSPDTDPAP
ncbi:MAG: nitroreductase family deazaflavin-dependent oxidoreductase, partial [Anaerolineae bacterium]|nr:nitroreductase family deazaflavin-dependent oxidoreductase [Anaerolineae bacterium]